MNKRKVHVQAVCNGGSALGTTGIWGDNDGILEVWNVLLDVALEQWLAVQVVDWDVEEALVLGVVQIHGDDVVGPCTGEKISDERSGLCDPLLVTWLWLEELRTGDGGWVLVVVSSEMWSVNTVLLGRAIINALSVGAPWWGNAVCEVVLQICLS